MPAEQLDGLVETIAEIIYDKLSDADESYVEWGGLQEEIKDVYIDIASDIVEVIKEELSEGDMPEAGDVYDCRFL